MRTIITIFFSLFPLYVFCATSHPEMPPVVQTSIVKLTNWQQQIQLIGSLSSLNGVIIKPEISGRISNIYFDSGQDVKKGTPLISLNQDILQAQLESSFANLQLRNQQFKRAQELFKLHALATADLETSRANLLSAKAAYQQSEAQLKQAIIIAPFSGRLGLNQVNVGDFIQSGQPIVNLESLDPMGVEFSIPEVYLSQISKNSIIHVSSDAYPGQPFKGKVYALDNTIDPQTRTLAVRALIPNPEKKLLPGAFVTVSFPLGVSRPVIMIPQTALVSSLDGFFVYKVIANKAIKTSVVVEKRNNKNAIITSGLKPGDIIVSAGQMKINGNNSSIIIASQ